MTSSNSSVTPNPLAVSGPQECAEGPNGGSYAVAIYPYMAEHENELDVMVGDPFVILSRSPEWWVVQRDLSGCGTVDDKPEEHGRVPAGCLLETEVTVISLTREANADGDEPLTVSPRVNVQSLPLSTICTNYPGVALMDYKKLGEEEVSLKKGDALLIFKWYKNWEYVVKERGGDRGWVPAEYVEKTAVPLIRNLATHD